MPLQTFAENIHFGEGPRWHNDALWCSDMHGRRVLRFGADGAAETILEVPHHPSGLGWRPDGTLLVVSMENQQVLQFDGNATSSWADLSKLTDARCNDMVVDAEGRAYVGNFGFDLHRGEKPRPTNLILIDADGHAREVARDLKFPNGMIITPDQRTLIVAESFGARLTAFSIERNGDLTHRRIWAEIEGSSPDGICFDDAGGVWVASPASGTCFRVEEGGQITDELTPEATPFACILGGALGKTLFILIAPSSHPDKCAADAKGKIVCLDVAHARAGKP